MKDASRWGNLSFGVNLFNFDINQITFTSFPFIALFIIAVLLLIYLTRNRVGFYLRKKVPITIFQNPEACKSSARILFIDDKDVPHERTLSDDGWFVKTLRDSNTDSTRVKEANIIFVDWKGVGKRISSESEGISLADNIKRKYGSKKYVILYSTQEYQKPDDISADDWLNKGSSFSAYMQAINKATFALLC